MVDGLPGVKVTLAQKKFQEMCTLVEALLKAKGMVDISKVKQAAFELELLEARRGDPAHQTSWEFLAMLIAVDA
eukprot:5005229-Amphidinium_carterae.2